MPDFRLLDLRTAVLALLLLPTLVAPQPLQAQAGGQDRLPERVSAASSGMARACEAHVRTALAPIPLALSDTRVGDEQGGFALVTGQAVLRGEVRAARPFACVVSLADREVVASVLPGDPGPPPAAPGAPRPADSGTAPEPSEAPAPVSPGHLATCHDAVTADLVRDTGTRPVYTARPQANRVADRNAIRIRGQAIVPRNRGPMGVTYACIVNATSGELLEHRIIPDGGTR
jgi:hypothetical protein